MSPYRFSPAWWLPGPHLQTVWQSLFRHNPLPATDRERLDLPDGDFVDLDWFGPSGRPIVILLHGLSGSSRSPYIRGLQSALALAGLRTVAMNFRGCSGHPNRTSRGYHSGETGDLGYVHDRLREHHPGTPIGCVGFSLGGNVLLKWLGEQGQDAAVFGAVAVSAPLLLDRCADRLDMGFSRVYRNQLLRELRDYIIWKREYLDAAGLASEARKLHDIGDLSGIRSFWQYDTQVVARLYGYRDAQDYYQQAASRPYLQYIQRPTLIIQADDDPFMTPAVLPQPHELSPSVRLEVTAGGGHVGFITGHLPWRPRYWLEEIIPRFLTEALREPGSC